MGLMNQVVPRRLRPTVMSLAQAIAAERALTVAACKVAIGQTQQASERRDRDRLAAMVEACFRFAGLPRGPGRVRREAPAPLQRPLTLSGPPID